MSDQAIRRAITAFDWDWCDILEGESARSQALAARPAETALLASVVSADSIVSFGIGSALPVTHPVPQLWLETQTDLQSTIYLAYGGFFRQAFTILRSWFELSVYGVYFARHYGQPSSRYSQWRRGARQAPANMVKVCQSLGAQLGHAPEVKESDLVAKLEPLYAVLSQHAHGQGLDVFDLQDGRDNVPRFLEHSWDLWYDEVLSVFDAICFLYRVFFAHQLRKYLGASQAERRRASALARKLRDRVPELGALIDNATGQSCPAA